MCFFKIYYSWWGPSCFSLFPTKSRSNQWNTITLFHYVIFWISSFKFLFNTYFFKSLKTSFVLRIDQSTFKPSRTFQKHMFTTQKCMIYLQNSFFVRSACAIAGKTPAQSDLQIKYFIQLFSSKQSTTNVAPYLRVWTLVPQYLCQVISLCMLQGMFKHLHFLHQRQVVVILGHLSYKSHAKLIPWTKSLRRIIAHISNFWFIYYKLLPP